MHLWRAIALAFFLTVTTIAQVAGDQHTNERLILRVLSAPGDLDLDRRCMYYPYPFSPMDSIAAVYRARCSAYSLRLDGLEELEVFRAALAWVGTRWKHSSDNTVAPSVTTLELLERAQHGEQFTCVEYARLLVDVLVSHGYPARVVGLSKEDIETRPQGARHVAVEAWSTTYHKWVFLDPQWGCYPCMNGAWLSAYELVNAIVAGKLEQIELVPAVEVCAYYRITPDELVEQYRAFLAPYTGYLDYPYVYDGKYTLLMYICKESLPLPLAFQGVPLSGLFYTRSWRKAYGALDQTHVTFRYSGDYHPQRGFTQPAYTLDIATTLPWVQRFEVRHDSGSWEPITSARHQWTLHRGVNTIELRAVGYSGMRSRSASVTVFWGLPRELPKLTSTQ
jgi:hypothetical protein